MEDTAVSQAEALLFHRAFTRKVLDGSPGRRVTGAQLADLDPDQQASVVMTLFEEEGRSSRVARAYRLGFLTADWLAECVNYMADRGKV